VTKKKAIKEYGNIKGVAQKLKAVKEQILIQYLGLGWEKLIIHGPKPGNLYSE